MSGLTEALARGAMPDELHDRILTAALDLLRADAAILVRRRAAHDLHCVAALNVAAPLQQVIVQWLHVTPAVPEGRERLRVHRLRKKVPSPRLGAALRSAGHVRMIRLAILLHGEPVGELVVLQRRCRHLDAGRLDAACMLADQVALAWHTWRLNMRQQRAQRQLERVQRSARRAIRAREDLLATVSHDLRTPLGVISMKAEALRRALQRSPGLLQELDGIMRHARYMEKLIEDLLDLSQIKAGSLRIAAQPQALLPVLQRAVEAVYPLAGGRAILFRVDDMDAQEGPAVYCDAHRVLQVMTNLLGNAIKFTAADGRIAVNVARVGRQIRVSVRDDGAGIDPEALPQLFQRYQQGGRHDHRGVGLGLFIARTIIEAHGGKMWVSSTPGAGSTFHFTLPEVVGESAHRTVLVVDDDVSTRHELTRILVDEGFSVATAANGQQALRYLRQHATPSLILLDLVMPVMDGWAFQDVLQSDPELASVPTFVMSGLRPSEVLPRLRRVAGYLRKPLRRQELLQIARRHVLA